MCTYTYAYKHKNKNISTSTTLTQEDLVQAIATSCHIPAYNDGSFVKEYRGQVGQSISADA